MKRNELAGLDKITKPEDVQEAVRKLIEVVQERAEPHRTQDPERVREGAWWRLAALRLRSVDAQLEQMRVSAFEGGEDGETDERTDRA